jgi:alpha-D-ribose 1-methylphosphonate 5-triphosphate synthase subunit PhnH
MARYGVPLLLFLTMAVAVLSGSAAADTPTLMADVGPGFNISLKDTAGNVIRHLDPGEYTIQVEDKSDMHNFALTGPGVSKSTMVADLSSEIWHVTFVDGTYKYVCDAHVTTMKGAFTVGNVPAAAATMAGSVGPGRQIALARSAKAGKTIITVRDKSNKDNFHLTGPGVNKKTGVAFKGTVKWTVMLQAGTYTVKSDAHKTLKRTLKVT